MSSGSSLSLSSMFVDKLLFSVVSVHGLKFIGGISVRGNCSNELSSGSDDVDATISHWL